MLNAKLCLLNLLIIVAACTTQPNKVATAGPDLQCHSEETTGTLVTKSVCTTRAQRVVQQAELDDLKREIQTGAAAGSPTVLNH